MSNVYINRTAKFLPNAPVSNEDMELYLGLINNKPSKSKRIVLRNNGIKQRYYAMGKDGKSTHTNAQMAAAAVRSLFDKELNGLKSFQLLACGTSSPDQALPSHGAMVHGWLPESSNAEVISTSGACCSGMHALKYAYMAIKSGEVQSAVATGSERLSGILRSATFENEDLKLSLLEENPYIGFEKDFLRWMLSDGAGALLLSDKKSESGISLRVEWLEGVSYANEVEVCMYMGSEKLDNGDLKSYMDFSPEEVISKSVLSIKQDVKVLSNYIVSLGYDKLNDICKKRKLNLNDINYFLPHLSSNFFRDKIAEKMNENGMHIPDENWFTNLSSVGNVGAGSIYLMIDELFNSGKLKIGEKVLVIVPESSRFSYVFGLFTVC